MKICHYCGVKSDGLCYESHEMPSECGDDCPKFHRGETCDDFICEFCAENAGLKTETYDYETDQ